GSTAFGRGLPQRRAAPPGAVSGPSSELLQESGRGNTPLYHLGLSRLEPHEIDDLGLDELVGGDGIVAIEWADRWSGRPHGVVEVDIADEGGDERLITIRRKGWSG